MKLWHDDLRRPPDDTWTWARTNQEAMSILRQGNITECSLDHDMGLEHHDPDDPNAWALAGTSPHGDGLMLVRWMVVLHNVPTKVTIHSLNTVRAKAMADLFNDHGYNCYLTPYTPPSATLLGA